jgi:hypothetical protein
MTNVEPSVRTTARAGADAHLVAFVVDGHLDRECVAPVVLRRTIVSLVRIFLPKIMATIAVITARD